jgi:hypothetical protein
LGFIFSYNTCFVSVAEKGKVVLCKIGLNNPQNWQTFCTRGRQTKQITKPNMCWTPPYTNKQK